MRVCPFCGEMISDRAKACPHCGSDEQTGWQSDFYSDEGFEFEPDEHENQSEGWLNPKKHPVTAIGFLAGVGLLIALFIYQYVL